MRVQLLSDLHVEFYRDRGAALVDSFDPTGVDVLVLAGDVGTADTIVPALRWFCARYAGATVLFVLGNHEWYGSTTDGGVLVAVRALEAEVPNLRVLDDRVVEAGGVRFAGSTLWFRDAPDTYLYRRALSDFGQIREFDPWVYEANRRSEAFLRGVLSARMADVVVTHHLPSERCVAPQYKGSAYNRFFVCPLADELPPEHLPRFWLYGHTHTPADEVHDGCRFVCNPLGYPHEPKLKFRRNLVLDVQPGG